jgi:transposase
MSQKVKVRFKHTWKRKSLTEIVLRWHYLESLYLFLQDIESVTGVRPPIVLESTGHYHTTVVQYFEERDYLIIIVNPLFSYRAKSSSLRKVKNRRNRCSPSLRAVL